MTVNEFLTELTRIVFVLVALVTLGQWLRTRDRSRLDIALAFVSLSLSTAIQEVERIFGLEIAWLNQVGTLALLAHPYFLLRIAHYFRPIGRRLRLAALLGLLISAAAFLVGGESLTGPAVLLVIAYFVGVESYATSIFIRGALTTSGITKQRLRLASAGSALLAAIILTAGVLIVAPPAFSASIAPLIQLFAVLAGLSYYVGFSPPRWLRHAWQLTELQRYLHETSGHWGQQSANTYSALTSAAVRTTGGMSAMIAHWDFDRKTLSIDAPGDPPWSADGLENGPGALARSWRDRRARIAAWPQDVPPEAAAWAEQAGAQSLIVIPLASLTHAWGLLIVALRHAPLFPDDDLELLAQLAGQTAVILDHGRALEELKVANQALDQRVSERTADLQRSLIDLQDSEERFGKAFNASPDGVAISRLSDGLMVEVNESYCTIVGFTSEEMLGKTSQELGLLDPEDRRPIIELLTKQGFVRDQKLQLRRKSGEKIWVETSTEFIDLRGERFLLSIVRDISARLQMEAALRHSEERFRLIVEAAPSAMIVVDREGKINLANTGAQELFGYDESELLGQAIERLVPERFRAGHVNHREAFVRRAASRSMAAQRDLHALHKDGHEIPVEIGLTPYESSQGTMTLALIVDISARQRAQQLLERASEELERQVRERTAELSEANTLLQTMMDNTPDHIYFKDAESRFIRNSRSQARMMGLKEPKLAAGKTDFDFFPKEHAQRSFDEEQDVIKSGRPLINIEERVVWPDGHETWVSTSKMPYRDAEDNVIGTFGISREITERKQAEESLRQSNAQLEAANKELESFSYSVSHDLRAPLRSIDGFSLALLEDFGAQLPPEGRSYLERARGAAQRMAELIDDILELSRVARAPLERRPVDLSALAESIAGELQRDQPARKVELTIAPELVVEADQGLLRIALENLLGNAWKFTSKRAAAHIELGVQNGAGEQVYFIRDNGSGFDMNYVDKLFGAFQRLHTSDEFPGTGIGLATVQRVFHKHGGRVWAEGAPDEGATFYFTL